MSKKVSVALIGAGAMANAMHYPSVTSFDDVEILGLCDIDTEKLKTTAEKFNIKSTFSDYREMLDKTKPDAVYALMPPYILFDVAMDVLQRGHNLFIEKPPAVTVEQTQALAKAAKDKSVITAVGFQRRYHPTVKKAAEMASKKGKIHQIVSSFYKCLPPQDVHPYYRGAIDILRSDAIHALDAIRFYAGLAEVKKVVSEVRTLDCWYPVSFNAMIYFDNDVLGILQANWRTGKRIFKFEFHSLDASAYVDIDKTAAIYYDDNEQAVFETTVSEFVDSDKPYIVQGFYAENRAFIDAVKAGSELHNNLADAVKTMQLADMIYQNAINK